MIKRNLRWIGWILFVGGLAWTMPYFLSAPGERSDSLRRLHMYPGFGIMATGMFLSLLNGVLRSLGIFTADPSAFHRDRHRTSRNGDEE